ncbi:hypothetical protein BH20ACT13_BH20ACT13_06120 [soil metagenome]
MRAEYRLEPCKSAMNAVRGMPFKWSLNPYMGCVHRCTFCYVRPLGLDSTSGRKRGPTPGLASAGAGAVGQLGLAIVWSFWHALQPDWWPPLCVLFLANRSRLSRFAHTEHFFPVVAPGIGVVLVAAIVSSSPPRP